jgi:hypothetical protein
MLNTFWNKFWAWYERNYKWNVGISAGLFLLQLVHLYWLSTDVVLARIFGHSFFHPNDLWRTIIILVDYTEIPALIGTSLLYLNSLRKKYNKKDLLYLIFLNIQWLHLFWITDEFVVGRFASGSVVTLPLWLAWTAILIDYLELPVIYETIIRFLKSLKTEVT